ncbi:hypothetical protein MN608_09720 [Microdochium nivale]|nr:hypothetical protein MN608_09720 [Microdochium nivale]
MMYRVSSSPYAATQTIRVYTRRPRNINKMAVVTHIIHMLDGPWPPNSDDIFVRILCFVQKKNSVCRSIPSAELEIFPSVKSLRPSNTISINHQGEPGSPVMTSPVSTLARCRHQANFLGSIFPLPSTN